MVTTAAQKTHLYKQRNNSYAVLLPHCLIDAAVQCGVPVH